MRWTFPLWLLPLLCAVPADKPALPRPPLTPAQARDAFRLVPGLRIELVASEPQIESPVAMTFDEDGRLWVVEMRDYPNGPAKGQPPQGRIRILEDRDGDGRFEHSTVFADGLLFANGLLRWRDGVIVTAAPHVVQLRDTGGKGKADKRDILFEGFAALNPQLRVSHPTLGLDGWVYVANGLRGGQVKRAGKDQAIALGGMDFRFDPLGDAHEGVTGMGQFGTTFDDWGQRFVCDNRHHLRHIVLADRYLKRNPFLAVPQAVVDVSELEDGPLNSGGKIYPLSKNWTTSNLHAGRFTAACGVHVYRGNLLPKEFQGCAFTCDPTGNLVHQEILTPHGATFRGKPGYHLVKKADEKEPRRFEFLASPDEWCRPVFLTDGPDGALYVVDMARAVIEHPEFMPQELKSRPDLDLGKDRGRIWRIVPEDYKGKPPRVRLSKASVEELVALLDHPNSWHRTTAQRLLLQRQDPRAVDPLKRLLEKGNARARVLAGWLLQRLNALDESVLLRILKDGHPRVREQGVLLAEPRLAKSEILRERVVLLAWDGDARVRFQVALSLGEVGNARILPTLAEIGLTDADDPWARLAVASIVPAQASALVTTLLRSSLVTKKTPGRLALLRELAALVGARREAEEVGALLAAVYELKGTDAFAWQTAGLESLAEGMGRRGTRLVDFLARESGVGRETEKRTLALLDQAAVIATDARQESAERLAAVRLLAHAPWPTAGKSLARLLENDPSQDIRLAAIRSLAGHTAPEVAGLLLKSWRVHTPALRREAIEALLRQPDRILALLKEVEAGQIKPGDIDAIRTGQLLQHRLPEIRMKASKLLQTSPPAERQQALARYQTAVTGKGNARRGLEVFKKNCAACHHLAGVGTNVGPDISDTPRTKDAAALLVDILNPNAAIDGNYISYQVTTKSGKTLTGIIVAETAASVTLRRAEGQGDIVLRQDIEEVLSSGVSLMPEGLEKTISIEEMTDLLTFLKNWRYLDGSVPVP